MWCADANSTARGAALMFKKLPSRVWLMSGQLGSGKTSFVRGVLRSLGVRGRVTSPTFGVVKIYRLSSGRWRQAAHVDLYRLRHQSELRAIGLHELLDDPRTLVFVEWPAMAKRFRFGPAVRVRCVPKDHGRQFTAR